jgi:hypothetical protein
MDYPFTLIEMRMKSNEVEGFADSSGNAALNEKLSLERSQEVVDEKNDDLVIVAAAK